MVQGGSVYHLSENGGLLFEEPDIYSQTGARLARGDFLQVLAHLSFSSLHWPRTLSRTSDLTASCCLDIYCQPATSRLASLAGFTHLRRN